MRNNHISSIHSHMKLSIEEQEDIMWKAILHNSQPSLNSMTPIYERRPCRYCCFKKAITTIGAQNNQARNNGLMTCCFASSLVMIFNVLIFLATAISSLALAINPIGETPLITRGTVTENPCEAEQVPLAPVMIRANNIRNDSAKLAWSMSVKNITVSEFVLGFGKIPDEFTREIKNPQTRSYILEGLVPSTEYAVSLRAKNCAGDGPPVYTSFKTLSPNRPDGVDSLMNQHPHANIAMALKVEPISPTSVALTWTDSQGNKRVPSTSVSSDIVRIVEVRHSIVGSSATSNSQLTNSASDSRSYTIRNYTSWENRVMVDDLPVNTTHAFSVRTYIYSLSGNRKMVRESPWSLETLCKTPEPEPPTAPLDLTIQPVMYEVTGPNGGSAATENVGLTSGINDPTKIELMWKPPLKANGVLQGYLVHLADDSQPGSINQWRSDRVGAGRTNALIRDLLPNVTYSFKIQAVNEYMTGPFSNIKTYHVPAIPSSSPSSIAGGTTNRTIDIGPFSFNFSLLPLVLLVVAVVLSMIVGVMMCRTRRLNKPSARNNGSRNGTLSMSQHGSNGKLPMNGYTTTNSVSRMATLGRGRRDHANDLWINQVVDQVETKSSTSDQKAPSEMNLAMVSIKRDSPKFTTQLAGGMPTYGTTGGATFGHQASFTSQTQQPHQYMYSYDDLDDGKRMPPPPAVSGAGQGAPNMMPPPPMPAPNNGMNGTSMIQPPPPLNIEQSQLYGTGTTRSLRLKGQLVYDPVAGSFVQNDLSSIYGTAGARLGFGHQHSATLSRRSSATLRSFQVAGGFHHHHAHHNGMMATSSPQPSMNHHLIQIHPQQQQQYQGVINQLNSTPYSSLPLKHVSAVRPQIMSSDVDSGTGEISPEKDNTIKQQ